MNFGISQSYISRLDKKIINKMKKEIISKTGQKFFEKLMTKKYRYGRMKLNI